MEPVTILDLLLHQFNPICSLLELFKFRDCTKFRTGAVYCSLKKGPMWRISNMHEPLQTCQDDQRSKAKTAPFHSLNANDMAI